MAHSLFHFFIGLTAGSLCFLNIIFRPWLDGEKMSNPLRRWLILSYAIACFAIIPNLLCRAGLPQNVCASWWMNIFVLYPVINKLKDGGSLIGQVGITLFFILQYLCLLGAIARTRRNTSDVQ